MISSLSREILSCCHMHADWSASQIAKEIGARTHQVHYSLQQLKRESIIRWLPLVDLHRLGLNYFGLYFSLAGDHKSWLRLRRAIQQNPYVSWLSEFAGEFQAGMAIVTENPRQASEVFDSLINQAKVEVVKKSFATRTALLEVPRAYLSTRTYAEPRCIAGMSSEKVNLSAEEMRMLQCILTGKFDSYREAARILGISHTTLDAFMRRAQGSKVLLEPVYSIDVSKIGRSGFKLLITLRGDPKKSRAKVKAHALSLPETHHIVDCFGSWDLEVNVDVEKTCDLSKIIHDFYAKNQGIVDEVKALLLAAVHKRFSVDLSCVKAIDID